MISGVPFISATAHAAPSYPNISDYQSVGALERFRLVNRDGVWFTSPLGLHCGIADDGGYGCFGTIPGVEHNQNEIAWSPGDPVPILRHVEESKFDSGRPQTTILILESVLSYRGSRCAVTVEGAVYCINGENADSQLMVSGRSNYLASQAISGT